MREISCILFLMNGLATLKEATHTQYNKPVTAIEKKEDGQTEGCVAKQNNKTMLVILTRGNFCDRGNHITVNRSLLNTWNVVVILMLCKISCRTVLILY